MGALLGSLSAIAIGLADLLIRLALRRTSNVTATVLLQVGAVPTAVLAVMLFGGTATIPDMVIGLVSGVGAALGALMYYGAMDRSSATIVSPTVSVLVAAISLAYAVVVKNATPSTIAWLGAATAATGLLFVTIGNGRVVNLLSGLWWSGLSGACYGIAFAILLECSDDAGSWPIVAQRASAALLLGGVARGRGGMLLTRGRAVWFGLAGGALAGASSILYLVGLRFEATATVVTSSMFPAVSVAACAVAFDDPVSRRQIAGIGLVLAGVAAIAAG